MDVTIQIVNAFVDGDIGGNPAGVVLDADNLTAQQKLQIAKEVGLSETAFVSKSEQADFRLEFFTPARQIAHCGHATIATFSYLNQLRKIKPPETSKETIDGIRKVSMRGEAAFMEQFAPSYKDVSDSSQEILKSLGIEQKLLQGAQPMVVNTGNSFLLVAVDSIETLRSVEPDFALINSLSERWDLIGFYVFSTQSVITGRDATARMFAPRYGISEEAATGMAAGPLASYLYDVLNNRKKTFIFEQGHFMTPPSPSLITVDLELKGDKIMWLFAGGKAKLVKSFIMQL